MKPLAGTATQTAFHDRRAGIIRVLANALLVLLAFDLVTLAAMTLTVVAGGTLPVPPGELVLVTAVFILVRWVVVLPGMLPVLVGLEYVARRARHARVLTAIVAFTPMVWWQLSQSPDGFSGYSAILGGTAVLFAAVARLPARVEPGASVRGASRATKTAPTTEQHGYCTAGQDPLSLVRTRPDQAAAGPSGPPGRTPSRRSNSSAGSAFAK